MNEIIEGNLSIIVEPMKKQKMINNFMAEMAKMLQHSHLNTKLNAESFDAFNKCMSRIGFLSYWYGGNEVHFNKLIYTQTDPFETTQYFYHLFAHCQIEFTDQMKGTLQALLKE